MCSRQGTEYKKQDCHKEKWPPNLEKGSCFLDLSVAGFLQLITETQRFEAAEETW